MYTIDVASSVTIRRKGRDAAFHAAAAALTDRHAPDMDREHATITGKDGDSITVRLAKSPMGCVSTGIEEVA